MQSILTRNMLRMRVKYIDRELSTIRRKTLERDLRLEPRLENCLVCGLAHGSPLTPSPLQTVETIHLVITSRLRDNLDIVTSCDTKFTHLGDPPPPGIR